MQPLERLVNLVALLLEARQPFTFERIREEMPEAYEQGELESAKRMFERDKDILRDIGVPIEVVGTDAWEAEQGYTIRKDAYYLPEIAFTPEEISALFVAATAGRQDTNAEEAVRKLLYGADGGILAGVRGFGSSAEGSVDAHLSVAADAVAEQRRVHFTYRTSRGEESDRLVDAYGLAVRGGHWYLVGLDRDRDEIRSFRLSRLASGLRDDGEGTAPPDGFRAGDHLQVGPWGPGEPQERARIAFAPEVAWWATKGIADAEVVATRDDGWVVVSMPAGPGVRSASWILSFGPDAEALEPPALRDEVVRRLETTLASL
jgi:proteasome accessory factor B